MRITVPELQLTAAAVGFTVTVVAGVWLWVRQRPTANELERRRRAMLVTFGRLVDGQLLDSFEITSVDGETRQMLLYTYEIAGVSYECSQDITTLAELLDADGVKVGMPCSIRYQPGSPENSILIAEGWSGLRNELRARAENGLAMGRKRTSRAAV